MYAHDYSLTHKKSMRSKGLTSRTESASHRTLIKAASGCLLQTSALGQMKCYGVETFDSLRVVSCALNMIPQLL